MADKLPIEAPFAASFPLPFRVLVLAGIGIFCWATNLHGLHLLGIDVPAALELRPHDDDLFSVSASRALSGLRQSVDPASVVRPVYRLGCAYALWTFIGWALFRYCTYASLSLVDQYKFIPTVITLVALMVLVSPLDIFQKRERDLFLLAIKRCCLAPANMPVCFSDIVLADIFTSFAKVIGDIWLSICMLMPSGSMLIFPSQDGWSNMLVPTLMSIPYFVRFRQCLIEYMLPTNTSKRPLYNALKYASSFPVIFLSAAQRTVSAEILAQRHDRNGSGAFIEEYEHPLFRLWLLSVAVNSLYSYWWDVTNDWGLELLRPHKEARLRHAPKPLLLPILHANADSIGNAHHRHFTPPDGPLKPPSRSHSPSRSSSQSSRPSSLSPPHAQVHGKLHRTLLRPTLLLPRAVYPLALASNLLLRLTWSLKLSSHLHARAGGGALVFAVEVAELMRRWMWVFLRVEWECVRRTEGLCGLERGERVVNGGEEAVELERVIFEGEAEAREEHGKESLAYS